MEKNSFIILNNYGDAEEFTNACMWICIADYIKFIQNDNSVSVKQLRKEAGFYFANNEFFDIDKNGHTDSINKLLRKRGLQAHLFYANEVDRNENFGWIGKPQIRFGDLNSKKIIPIVGYGNHFELILSKTATTSEQFILPEVLEKNSRERAMYIPKTSYEQISKNSEFDIDKICLLTLRLSSLQNDNNKLEILINNVRYNLKFLKNQIIKNQQIYDDLKLKNNYISTQCNLLNEEICSLNYIIENNFDQNNQAIENYQISADQLTIINNTRNENIKLIANIENDIIKYQDQEIKLIFEYDNHKKNLEKNSTLIKSVEDKIFNFNNLFIQ